MYSFKAKFQSRQKGAALILTLILIAVLSVMTVSMMYLSRTETLSTHNFKLSSQARDVAEAGINQAANFIINDYVPPTAAVIAAGDFDRTVFPVQINASNAVAVLSANGDYAGTYANANAAAATAQTAFAAAAQGTLDMDTVAMTYETTATLLAMRNPTLHGIGKRVLQRWNITSKGSLVGNENAEVEVSAILDRTTQPTFGYAAFGISKGCGGAGPAEGVDGAVPKGVQSGPFGLQFGGATMTNSYNSNSVADGEGACNAGYYSLSSTNCALRDTGGNIGTNGSLNVVGGSVDINGTLSSPRAGVGACDAGYAVDNPDVLEEGLVHLPQELVYPNPDFPPVDNPISTDTLPNSTTCPLIPGCTRIVPATKGFFNLAPGTYGNIAGGPGGAKEIRLSQPGVYNFNSLSLGSQVTVRVMPGAGGVTINISGCLTYAVGNTACTTYLPTPISTTGGSFANNTLDATELTINYAGPGTLQMRGNSGLAAAIYAPSARVESVGTADFYGSVIANEVDWTGTSNIHYDRALEGKGISYGPWMMQGFTWKKF